jgi:16S rRNA (uracil1498-N3)-methyltransferase
MKLNRFYTERKNLRERSSIKLNDSDIEQIRKIFRLQRGAQVIIFNGEKEFLAELTLVTKEVVMAKILEVMKDFRYDDAKVEYTVFQSLLGSGKVDTIVEKLTELGINNIVPMAAEYSPMKLDYAHKKIERWEKLSIVASKSSQRQNISHILEPIQFIQIKDFVKDFDLVLVCTTPAGKTKDIVDIKDLKLEGDIKKVAFLIGPEGGFSPGEIKIAEELALKFIKLGNNTLKSDTAAVAVFSVLKYILG